MCQAPSTHHRTSNPMLVSSSMMVPRPRVRSLGLFSEKTNVGCVSLATRSISKTSPERVPASPLPVPAALTSWQGKPPETTSTEPLQGRPSKVLMSSQIGNLSRCPSRCLARRTLRAKASSSTAHWVRHPSKREANKPPPAPANNANSFMNPLKPDT